MYMNSVVIGSGFGGIAAALRARAKKHNVTLIEKHDDLGGRARVFKKNGFTFDAGPTVITAPYLIDELSLELLFYENQPVSIELPITVDLEVIETEPGYKGDTAQGGTKPAVVETGLKLMVPLFIESGNVVKVDTRNDTYVSRV